MVLAIDLEGTKWDYHLVLKKEINSMEFGRRKSKI